jgi:hypothetical protein
MTVKLLAALVTSALIFASSLPTRVSLTSTERAVDKRITAITPDESAYLLGPTRGVYLEGYGAVFTTELELVPNAAPNPFRPEYTKKEIARLKSTKQYRISILKKKMRDTLIAMAAPMEGVGTSESIVLAVTIPYFNWEDTAGMPRQIVMQAPKSALLKGAQGDTAAVEAALKVHEF